MKPAVRGVLGHFRRKSLPAGTTIARRNKQHAQCPFDHEDTLLRSRSVPEVSPSTHETASFFDLPTELHIQILFTLQYNDLSNFRAASTRTRDLVSEGEVIRQWILLNADKQQLKLYPPPPEPTFQYVLDQRVRNRRANEFATLLAEYIEREILRYTLRRLDNFPNRSRADVFQAVKAQLRDRMVPLVLTAQHYLGQSAAILLDTIGSADDGYRPVYRRQERKVIESYDSEHLHLVHKFWMFLIWLSEQILHRPSYAGTVERTVRGWSMEPLNRFEYRLFLIFGNIDALIALIKAGSPKARRKVIDTFLARLDPERHVLWQKHWQDTGATGERVTKEQAKSALGLELSATDVWYESAEIVLIAKDMILPQANIPIGTPWQVMDFLSDLAGYDVLRLPPSMQ